MTYAVYFIPVLLLGFWYWNYFRKVKAAGGTAAFAEQQAREQFGLAPGETMTAAWHGVYYIGRAKPFDPNPSADRRAMHEPETYGKRGANLMFGPTSHGRFAFAMEPEDGPSMHKANAMFAAGSYYKPFVAFDRSFRPRVFDAAAAFPHAEDAHKPGPERVGHGGGLTRLGIAHVQAPDGRAFTFWGDPVGLQSFWSWSQS